MQILQQFSNMLNNVEELNGIESNEINKFASFHHMYAAREIADIVIE